MKKGLFILCLLMFSGVLQAQIPGLGCMDFPPCCVVDEVAYSQVIAGDPFCCSIAWDGMCQAAYNYFSNSCVDLDTYGMNCSMAIPLLCGTTEACKIGQTPYDGIGDEVSCMTGFPENSSVWYVFEINELSKVNITNWHMFGNVTGRVFKGSCDQLTCWAMTNEAGVYDQCNDFYATPGTYFLRLHAQAGGNGNFSIEMNCYPLEPCPNPQDYVSNAPWWMVNQDAFYKVWVPNCPLCTGNNWGPLCFDMYLNYAELDIPESDWNTPDVTPECVTDPCGIDAALMANLDCLYNWTPECQTYYDAVSGTCLYGCTDPEACNYDPFVGNSDNDSCDYSCLCPGDFNGDGIVSYEDLSILLGQLDCVSDCLADLNGDGLVTWEDLTIFLSLINSECP